MKLTRLNELIEDGEVVKGTWELLPGHTLGYRGRNTGEEYRFKAPVIAAEPDAIVAAATVRQNDQTVVTRILKLTGRWKTDGKNRLVFEAERAGGKTDQLTLTGTWKLGDANEIIHTYRSEASAAERRAAARSGRTVRRDKTRELIFRGRWELSEKNHITYLMEGSSDSAFRFRGAFGTPSILAKKGEIRFSIGAEAAGRTRAAARSPKGVQTVTFFGSWKIGRDWALNFELDEGLGRRKRVFRFGADWTYQKGRTLSAQLKNERGRPLGVELVWTRAFALARGEGEIFARIGRSFEETRAEAGGRLRW